MANPKNARLLPIPQRVLDRMAERTVVGALRVPRTRKACDLWLGGLNGAMRPFIYWSSDDGVNRYAGVSEVVYRVHRLLGAELPLDVVVCHACDVATCVCPDHLYIGDRHMNMSDLKRRGSAVEQGVAKMEVWAQLAFRHDRGLLIPPALARNARALGLGHYVSRMPGSSDARSEARDLFKRQRCATLYGGRPGSRG